MSALFNIFARKPRFEDKKIEKKTKKLPPYEKREKVSSLSVFFTIINRNQSDYFIDEYYKAGAFIGAGIGLGMGNQIGGMLGNAFQQSGVANAFNTQSAPPPPPGTQQAAMYYVALNGQTTGPFDVTQLRELITRGVLTPTTFVFLQGGTAWVRAQEENLVRSLFGVPQPPAPPQE